MRIDIECLVCNRVLNTTKRGFANHIRTHGITISEYNHKYLDKPLPPPRVEGDEFVKCPVCGKLLVTLRKHLTRTHGWTSSQVDELGDSIHSNNHKKRLSKRGTTAANGYWKDKEYRIKQRNRDVDPYRLQRVREVCSTKEFSETMSEVMTDNWKNPEYREATIEGIKNSPTLAQSISDKWDCPDFRRRCTNRRARYDHTKPDGTVIELMSTWEVEMASYLDSRGIPYDSQPFTVRYFSGINRRYIPDFYLPDLHLILEVHPKPLIDEIMLLKEQACLSGGYKFLFITEHELWDRDKLDQLINYNE